MQSQGTLVPASGGAGVMASGFDVSAWDTSQVALFEALGEVVDTVGAKNAEYHAKRISSRTPSLEFLERMRRLEADSKFAQGIRMLLGESAESCSHYAASEAEACQMRIRHLMVKEQILNTLSTDAKFENQSLEGIRAQYEGTHIQSLAEAMAGMREKVITLEIALGAEGKKMTPEEMKNKVMEWRTKAWDWDKYVTAAEKKSAEAREAERGEDVEKLADTDGTDRTAEEKSAVLMPMSNLASPKQLPKRSDAEVKEDRKKQQAKLKKAIDANRLLQAKLRQVSENRNRWSEYCEHLQKKLERSIALLKEHQVVNELLKTVEPEKGGPPRPQTAEKEGAVINAAVLEKAHARPSAILSRAEPEYQNAYVPRPQAGASSGAIQTFSSNAKIRRDDENGRLPPLLTDTYGQHSAYWKDIGSWPDNMRGPTHSEDHSMARGGLHMAECSTDALEALEMIKPGKAFVVNDTMKEALRTFKHPASGEQLAALSTLVTPKVERSLPNNTSGIDSSGGASPSANREPAGTSASATKHQEIGITDGPGNTVEKEPAQDDFIDQSDMLPESALVTLSPKLPRLLHTTTVPDSLASSTSVSQHRTSSTQAEHPTSGADTINANEVNQANAAAARPLVSQDELPVVVSERKIRKRKLHDSTPKKKIKKERIGSSPVSLIGFKDLQTQESMDLDDIGPKTATPKKRQEKQSATAALAVSEEYGPAKVYQKAPAFGLVRDEEDEKEAPDTPSLPKPSPSTPRAPSGALSILKPRSTNPILPRTSTKTYSAKYGRISDNGVDLFSEDGENYLADPTVKILNKMAPRAATRQLTGLLEQPSSRRWQMMNMDDEPDLASTSNFIPADTAKKATSSTKSTIAARQAVHQRPAAQGIEALKSLEKTMHRDYESDTDMPNVKELEKGEQKKALGGEAPGTPVPVRKINVATRSINSRNKVREDVISTAKPKEKACATKPASRLSLDDFRINPEYNNGFDYAYRDVVRGREKRMCLAGCTEPGCCGKGFRALAEISNPIRENLTPAEKEVEDKLLAEFLGRDASKLIKNMGKEERRETLIRAKTRELANKHGRHRHAYERRKSPPGFWRADFPTTQEEAEDREMAKVFERDLVQKRYEEAMRGGGKWIFKDHVGSQPGRIDKE